MKRFSSIAAALLLGVTGVGLSATPAAAADTTVVRGQVTSASGAPIAGVVFKVVRRASGAGFVSVHGRTGPTGRYAAELPRGGSYQVVVSDPGDRDADRSDGRWASASKTVRSERPTVSVDLTLQLGATLSGRVVDSSGAPVRAGAEVRAVLVRGPANESRWGDSGMVTYTRAGGAYRFSNLSAGTALITFTSTRKGDLSPRLRDGGTGGTDDRTKAVPVAVASGEVVSGIDFRFEQRPHVDATPTHVTDPAGDASDAIDITDVAVRNGAENLVITTTIPKFDPAAVEALEHCGGFGLRFSVRVRGAQGKPAHPYPEHFSVSVQNLCRPPGSDALTIDRQADEDWDGERCPAATVESVRGRITTTIPQSCFGPVKGAGKGAVQVAAAGNVWDSTVSGNEGTDATRWLRRG